MEGEAMEKLNYTFSEAAEVAQVSAPTLRAWTRTPGFPILRVGANGKGRKILIPCDAFRRFLEEQAMQNAERMW